MESIHWFVGTVFMVNFRISSEEEDQKSIQIYKDRW